MNLYGLNSIANIIKYVILQSCRVHYNRVSVLYSIVHVFVMILPTCKLKFPMHCHLLNFITLNDFTYISLQSKFKKNRISKTKNITFQVFSKVNKTRIYSYVSSNIGNSKIVFKILPRLLISDFSLVKLMILSDRNIFHRGWVRERIG